MIPDMKSKKPDRQLETKSLSLSIDDVVESSMVMRALASPDRLRIVALLGAGSMNVQQIAVAFELPMSTTAAHVRVLEDAGILRSESVPGVHGAMKLCSRHMDQVMLKLTSEPKSDDSLITLNMPLGGYSRVMNIQPTCGLAGAHSAIGEYDNPSSFYLPGRLEAQILWFRSGFVEYRFGAMSMQHLLIKSLELSFEACSEAPMYRNPWKSDISVYINGKQIGIWTSPADLGGRKGVLNPAWWPDVMTQYGYLCTFRVTQQASYLENAQISNITIDDLDIPAQDCITLRIGVEKDAQHVGGMNLFGDGFGDFQQAIRLIIRYQIK